MQNFDLFFYNDYYKIVYNNISLNQTSLLSEIYHKTKENLEIDYDEIMNIFANYIIDDYEILQLYEQFLENNEEFIEIYFGDIHNVNIESKPSTCKHKLKYKIYF